VPSGPIGEVTRTRMSNMRKAIGRNLSLSKQTIPHWYIRATVDADPMFAFYRAEKPRSGISLNDVVVAACARVVYEFPAFRSHIEGDELVELPTSNIGVAVGMEEGLVVPVVVGAERMSLAELASATKRVAESARAGKIEGMGQGVFTISNLGMYGVDEFDAIINPPEAAILAVGAVREQVIVKNGMMRPGRVMTVVLSCDHRVIDGRLAALFIGRLRDVLEHPELLA
jgi:pyruvate dehydrogenase E2 component (dihydrolipoamide acetyltransferase)